jgi:hypothetical protein
VGLGASRLLTQDVLCVPLDLVKKWQFHDMFKDRFLIWLDAFSVDEKHNVGGFADVEPMPSPNKREPPNPDGGSPPAKKPRITGDCIVECSAISQPLLLEAKIGKDGPTLQIRASHTIYIVNTGTSEVSVLQNSYVAGFGKGAFKLLPGQTAPHAGMKEFKLESHDDKVVFNGLVTTLGKVVADERAKKPDAHVAYHTLTTDATNSQHFTLLTTHRVAFMHKEDEGVAISYGNIGTKEDVNVWETKSTHVLWNVRWTAKGLMPVKPAIYLKGGDLVLAAGRACHVTHV